MQLSQRTTLLYQDDKSDKVYEVDLVQVGDLLYVVNFRYGKRGKNLREGSETASALPEAEARRAFDRLVTSKTRKGYVDVTGQDLSQLVPSTVSAKTPAKPKQERDPAARNQAILARLQAEVRGESPVITKYKKTKKDRQPWSIDRVIWRSGELGLTAAAPLLIQLLTPEPLRRYCVVWAVGNCGDISLVPQLEQIYRDPTEAEQVRNIAIEALFKLSPSHKTQLQTELIATLPPALIDPIQQADCNALKTALIKIFNTGTAADFAVLDRLYQIDNSTTRSVLLEVLRTAPFQPNHCYYNIAMPMPNQSVIQSAIVGIVALGSRKKSVVATGIDLPDT